MRVREPVNAWSHFVGLILATAGTILLLRLARGPGETVAFAVYGGSLVLLYAASTVYHALPLPPDRLRPLRTLDHIAIYFLIAGTYTPVAVVTLHGPSGLGAAGGRLGDRGGRHSVQDLVARRARSGSRPGSIWRWATWRCSPPRRWRRQSRSEG